MGMFVGGGSRVALWQPGSGAGPLPHTHPAVRSGVFQLKCSPSFVCYSLSFFYLSHLKIANI